MCRTRRDSAAFTLVELLVIIAIISLLLTMLMPMLSNVRQLALQVTCRNQYRQIGQAIHGFAATHDGRGPGNAWTFTTRDSSKWVPLWPTTIPEGTLAGGNGGWRGTLNAEAFHGNMLPVFLPMTEEEAKGRKTQLACPVVRPSAANYCRREMVINKDVTGGESSGSYYRLQGPYGKRVDPAPAPWDAYVEGAPLALFPQPSYQFALWEAEIASDSTNGITSDTVQTYPPGALPPYFVKDVTVCAGYPLYVGVGGWIAFRHTLPVDTKLYPTRATANFLFIDGHAESLTPNTKIESADRYNFR